MTRTPLMDLQYIAPEGYTVKAGLGSTYEVVRCGRVVFQGWADEVALYLRTGCARTDQEWQAIRAAAGRF